MEDIKETLLGILQDLKPDEYRAFLFHLTNIEDSKISKDKLEDKEKRGTVDLLVQTYDGDTIEMTKKLLEKIYKNDLLDRLTSSPEAPESGTSPGAETDPEDPVTALLPTLEALQTTDQRVDSRMDQFHWELTVDMNTVSRNLRLSDSNRRVTYVGQKLKLYPDHPDRFDWWCQLLCREALPDRCYWEVEWSGGDGVDIAVSYRGIRRKGSSNDCRFGRNDQSWSLRCSDVDGYSVWHNNIETPLSPRPASHRVYVDRTAGSLSFYEVSSDRVKHLLHTFSTTFTGEPLCAGFNVYVGSSVSLCSL